MLHRGSVPETHSDVSIRGLWEIQTEAIIDARFGDADADTWKPEVMDNLLDWWEKPTRKSTKRTVMTNTFFSPFVLSVDGIIGKEALVLLANLS